MSWNVVVSRFAVHHYPWSLITLYRSIASILRQGGIFVGVIPNLDSFESRVDAHGRVSYRIFNKKVLISDVPFHAADEHMECMGQAFKESEMHFITDASLKAEGVKPASGAIGLIGRM